MLHDSLADCTTTKAADGMLRDRKLGSAELLRKVP
jgi:hypothetical protein